METNEIINAMDEHAKAFGLEVTTIGQLAVQNRQAYSRIKRGSAQLDTVRKISAWLETDRAARLARAADRDGDRS